MSQSKLWDQGTLCITIAANIAESAIIGYPMCFPDSVVGFTADKEKTSEEFVYYIFECMKQAIQRASSGSTQDNTNLDFLNKVEFCFPPKGEQEKIEKVLSSIDRKIINNEEICSGLESVSKLLYNYWFMQFDYPDENGKPYKSSGGKMVWNEELKRYIPNGWEVGSIIKNSLTDVIANGVRWFCCKNYLPTANIVGEKITDGDWITYENKESRANMEPTKYSVWFAKMKNSIKHLSIPADSKWFIDKYILSTGFEGIQCDEKSFAFIHCLVNSEYFESHKNTVAHGATQESVNDDDLNNIKFVVPDENVLNRFSCILNPILEKKFNCLHENQCLASLRDLLLPMLMTRQVKVN